MYKGRSVKLLSLGDGLIELQFDAAGESVNKLDQRTLTELREAIAEVSDTPGARGVLLTSAKPDFIVGADINEFAALFKLPSEEIIAANMHSNQALIALEALPVPVVAVIEGFALGGGLELALAADYRLMSETAQIGLPEVKLGLIPGLGGTVRLPRIAGPAVAIDWITGGAPVKAAAAEAAGVIEAPSAGKPRDSALDLLRQAAAGDSDWRARRSAKRAALPISSDAANTLFAEARAKLTKTADRHQPAALTAVELMERTAPLDFQAAVECEAAAFASIAKTQAAASLVQYFLSDQALKKRRNQYMKGAKPPSRAAVLGAGIMGGGIAFTSTVRGIPVQLKDINQSQLDLGMSEAGKQMAKQVRSGRLTQEKAEALLAGIRPSLDYASFDEVDMVIEAVVEDIRVKRSVLGELESKVGETTIIASNTSSLRIDDLARPLSRPQNFAGMHFFNPVPHMPLVEVIRGRHTSDAAIASVVAYAVAMGKTPIVVKDGPGFLVNRIITPYMQAFGLLVTEGADFIEVDRVMEEFGWPMGPAYLNDVVGMDTGAHVAKIIRAGFPDRMALTWPDPIMLMVEHGRFGQKNGVGFYRYEADATGKPKKRPTADSSTLLRAIQRMESRQFADSEIIERMMLPLLIEAMRCLDDGTAGGPAEIDLAMMLGLGFPRHLGGPLKYADWLGAERLVAMSQRYASLGPQYVVPASLREMAASGQRYYGI